MAETTTAVQTSSPTALQYLDRAMGGLKELGLAPKKNAKAGTAPIVALLEQITDLDETRVTAIARTLDQMSLFNDVVREQVAGMKVGERYEGITTAFNSIRDDAKSLVDQYKDGKISTMERVSNIWMTMSGRNALVVARTRSKRSRSVPVASRRQRTR